MPRVSFTSHLQRYVDASAKEVPGATLREALEAVFAANPRLRGYLLDDQGRLRKHVMVFIDSTASCDRESLLDPLRPDSEVFVMQALSGG